MISHAFSLKVLILTVALLNCLSGCAGYYRSRSSEPVERELSKALLVVPIDEQKSWKRPEPKYYIDERALSPAYQERLKNPVITETRIYNEKTKWCGLTIWAGFPIPLWRPACRTYTELTIQNGVPISAREQYIEGSGMICGPLIPLLEISDSPLSERFCEEIRSTPPFTDGATRGGK